jgi:hypothetical protein
MDQAVWRTLDGKCGENNQTEHDISVANEPEVMTGGRDQQIEAVVTELMTSNRRTLVNTQGWAVGASPQVIR